MTLALVGVGFPRHPGTLHAYMYDELVGARYDFERAMEVAGSTPTDEIIVFHDSTTSALQYAYHVMMCCHAIACLVVQPSIVLRVMLPFQARTNSVRIMVLVQLDHAANLTLLPSFADALVWVGTNREVSRATDGEVVLKSVF